MTFTVNDALKTGWLRAAQVRAGHKGLARPIAWVNVMEVPDIIAWVKPHELLLTTLYPLRDVPPGSLDTFVADLAQHNLAGIVVKTGRYFDTIPEEMCHAANQAELPLIELRTEVSFDEIITDLLGQILSVQTRRLQHSAEVHRRFTNTVLTGGGLQHIAENLAQLANNPTAIIASDRRVLATAAPNQPAQEAFNLHMHTKIGQHFLTLDTTAAEQAYNDSAVMILRCKPRVAEKQVMCYACPIRVGEHNYGHIVLLEVNRLFDDDDAVAMEHAATVSALAITKDQAILAVERKFQSDFLDDLLAGRITSMEVVLSRSQTLGWNLARPCIVCVTENLSESEQRTYRPGTIDTALLESAIAAARHIDPEAIVVEKSGQMVFILPQSPQNSALPASASPNSSCSSPREGIDLEDTVEKPIVTTLDVPANRARERNMTAQLRQSFKNDVEMGRHLLRDLRFLQRERQFILGIGRRCEHALQLHRSYQQACQALEVGSQLQDAGNVIHFNDLGFQRILSQFENRAELHIFADEMLGALEEYDRHHRTDLFETLEALLNNNLNMAVAARCLHLHYNSLRYRLQKIEELTGPFMADARKRINLELALQIRKTSYT